MIVVTGATGKLGRLVVEMLLQKVPAREVAVAVRSTSKAAELAGRGVEVRVADYERPDTLSSAFRAGDRVLLISANEVGKRAQQHENVIAAARTAGVGLLAYTSILRADTSTLALASEHRATEHAIHASRLPCVLLRNGWYLENHTEQIGGILERGVIAGAADNGRFASAARKDYAEAAVAVLTSSAHDNKVYELAGDPFTLPDFAAELSRQTGKLIEYVELSPGAYKDVLVRAGLPPVFADVLVDSDLGAARGELDSQSTDLRDLIGRPPTSLREAIASVLRVPTASR